MGVPDVGRRGRRSQQSGKRRAQRYAALAYPQDHYRRAPGLPLSPIGRTAERGEGRAARKLLSRRESQALLCELPYCITQRQEESFAVVGKTQKSVVLVECDSLIIFGIDNRCVGCDF